jgi:8-oxo-dGTP diphosphatase
VVAAAIADGGGRWLMHRRPPDKHHGGLWEFPGGKVEPGETALEALVREVREELALALDPGLLDLAGCARSPAEQERPAIVILLYTSPFSGGTMRLDEGGEAAWFYPPEIDRLAKPPLDCELARQLFAMPRQEPG